MSFLSGALGGAVSGALGGGDSGYLQQMQQMEQQQQQAQLAQSQMQTDSSITSGWASTFQNITKELDDLGQAQDSTVASESKSAQQITQQA